MLESDRQHSDNDDRCECLMSDAGLGCCTESTRGRTEVKRLDEPTVIDNRFFLEMRVGRGGEGTVYRAIDWQSSNTVAIKISHPGAGVRRRLLEECKFLTQLHDPGLITVYGSGLLPDQRAYAVYEWVDGERLETIRRRGRLRLIDIIRLAERIARSLATLHRAVVIHRDVSAWNVLVPRDRDEFRFEAAKLIDLGMSEPIHEDQRVKGSRTPIGRVSGTSIYSAPEQLAGRPQSVTTDLYGMGALMFQLLFAHAPLAKGTMVSFDLSAFADWMRFSIPLARLESEVEIPGQPCIPGELHDLLSQLLRRNPEERPSSAEEVAHRLTALLATAVLDEHEQRPPSDGCHCKSDGVAQA